ncbi:MAG TPA: DUF2752 domain-containing protein [Pyrinomonadaceae bacterium]
MSTSTKTFGFAEALNQRRAQSKSVHASQSPAPARYLPASYWRACGVLLSLTTMFLIAALWNPPDEPQFVLCPFRALTHLPCPGCGMTRAFCALAHGEFWRAIKLNALSPLLFLVAMIAWARAAAMVLRAERVRLFLARLPRPTPLASKVMLGIVMIWWVTRLVGGF